MGAKKKPKSGEPNSHLNKTTKNIKFKRKAREMMEQHRKQALLDKSYREKEETKIDEAEGKIFEFIKDEEDENAEQNTFNELMDSLSTKGKHRCPLISRPKLNIIY